MAILASNFHRSIKELDNASKVEFNEDIATKNSLKASSLYATSETQKNVQKKISIKEEENQLLKISVLFSKCKSNFVVGSASTHTYIISGNE